MSINKVYLCPQVTKWLNSSPSSGCIYNGHDHKSPTGTSVYIHNRQVPQFRQHPHLTKWHNSSHIRSRVHNVPSATILAMSTRDPQTQYWSRIHLSQSSGHDTETTGTRILGTRTWTRTRTTIWSEPRCLSQCEAKQGHDSVQCDKQHSAMILKERLALSWLDSSPIQLS